MRRVQLVRTGSDDHGTMGFLGARGLDPLHTIEPPWRNNRRNRSCIPTGRYIVKPHRSPRFGTCLLITEVPGRSHVLFHSGNVGGDAEKGLKTHTHGCVLPGIRRGRIEVDGNLQKAVLSSRAAFRRLMAWAAEQPFELEIGHV